MLLVEQAKNHRKDNVTCGFSARLIVVVAFFLAHLADKCQAFRSTSRRRVAEKMRLLEKIRPDKGPVENLCEESPGDLTGEECRPDVDIDTEDDKEDFESDEHSGISGNRVDLIVWVALVPNQPSVGNSFSSVFTDIFSENLGDEFKVHSVRKQQQGNGRRSLQRDPLYDIYYFRTSSSLSKKQETVWWWQYNVTYECYYNNDFAELVLDITTLEYIQSTLVLTLRTAVITGDLMGKIKLAANGPGPLAIEVGTESLPDYLPGVPDESTETPTIVTLGGDPTDRLDDPEGKVKVDISEWTVQRYLALALFVFTFVAWTVSTSLATIVARQEKCKEHWSNLNTQEGVDQVLMTGWRVDGDKMEIFRKKDTGYDDDDSMLRGQHRIQDATISTEPELTVTGSNSISTTRLSTQRSG